MKKATYRQMRGACEMAFTGNTAEQMGEKCKAHVKELGQTGDADHKDAIDAMMRFIQEEQHKWYEEFRAGFASLQDA